MGIFRHIIGRKASPDANSKSTRSPIFENLEPRIMLSADGLLSCLNAPLHDDPLANESQQVIEYDHTQWLDTDESVGVKLPQIEREISSDPDLSKLSESESISPFFTLTLDESSTISQSEEKINKSSDNFNTENVGLVNTNIDNSQQSNASADITNNNLIPALAVDIIADETAMINPVIPIEDGSMPIYNSDADLSIEYATSIEPRGPPPSDIDTSITSKLDTYVASDEIAESSDVVGIHSLNAPDLPGLILVDTDISSWDGQIIYLDFDGAEDVIYNGPVTVGPFYVPAFEAPNELDGQEDLIISEILSNLEQAFAGTGIIFTNEQPSVGTQYSTIYIGGDDSAFAEYGSFLGLAEQVDMRNLDRQDDGWVFSAVLANESVQEYARALTAIIVHEAGHLLGYQHSSQDNVVVATAAKQTNPLKEVAETLFPGETFQVGNNPYSVSIGDLNGDGAADIVTANADSDNVSVLLGNGDGTFATQITYTVAANPISVSIGDLDGDGAEDIVTANSDSDSVSVLLGNGDGTFATQITYTVAANPISVSIGDLDGDSIADIVTANGNSNNVSVLLGNGDGTFAAQSTYAVGDDPRSVSIGDLNGDGEADIVTANYGNNNVSVLLGYGDGTFVEQSTYAVDNGPYSISVGDLNGDSMPDIVTANSISNNVSILFGFGDGSFDGQSTYSVGDDPKSVSLGDLNGDGMLDIVTLNNNSDDVSVLLSFGNGSFAGQSTYSSVTEDQWSFSLGDLNSDGILDIVTAGTVSDNISILWGNGDGTFATQSTYAVGDDPFSVCIGDLDDDGTLDLVTANRISDNVSVLLDNGDGTFGAQSTYAVGEEPYSVSIGDLDGDGAADIVTANFFSDNISVLLGNGDGTFAAQTTYAAGDNPCLVCIGDLDGNDTLDLVTTHWASNNISVLLGNGDGTFAAQSTYTAGYSAYSVSIGDLDGDGAKDIVTANRDGDNISVLLGIGDGTFAAQSTYAVGSAPESVSIGYLNGDGAADIVTANADSNNVSVLLGNGDGTFAAQSTYAVGDTPFSVSIGDLDSDGVLDLVTANWGSNNVSVLLGNGDGTFAAQSTYAVRDGPCSICIGDLDSNGAMDLVTANWIGDSVSVLLGYSIDDFGDAPGSAYGIEPFGAEVSVSGQIQGASDEDWFRLHSYGNEVLLASLEVTSGTATLAVSDGVSDLVTRDGVYDLGEGDYYVYVTGSDGAEYSLTAQSRHVPIVLLHGIAGSEPSDGHWWQWVTDWGTGCEPSILQSGTWSTVITALTTSPGHPYVLGEDLFDAVYDWRLSIFDEDHQADEERDCCVEYLVEWIEEAQSHWGGFPPAAFQVDIIAHSMGGLVAREYIQNNYYDPDEIRQLVQDFVTVGTPHEGAAVAYLVYDWLREIDRGTDTAEVIASIASKLGLVTDPVTATILALYDVAKTAGQLGKTVAGIPTEIEGLFPSLCQMIPTLSFIRYNMPWASLEPPVDEDYSAWLADLNDDFTWLPDGTDPKVLTFSAVGNEGSASWDWSFLTNLTVDQVWDSMFTMSAALPIHFADGDAIVTATSALLCSYLADGQLTRVVIGDDEAAAWHVALPSAPQVVEQFLPLVGYPCQDVTPVEGSGLGAFFARLAEGVVFAVIDPADGYLTDSSGNQVGWTSAEGLKNEIADAWYCGDAPVELILVPLKAEDTLTFEPSGVNGEYSYHVVSRYLGEETFAAFEGSVGETPASIAVDIQAPSNLCDIEEADGVNDYSADIGNQTVGTSQTHLLLRVENTCDHSIDFALSLVGSADLRFSDNGLQSMTVALGACQMSLLGVEYAPVTEGQANATLTVSAPDEATVTDYVLALTARGVASPIGPSVTSSWPDGLVNTSTTLVRIAFSEAIDDSTFTVEDVALTGPGGSVAGLSLSKVGQCIYDVICPSVLADGQYVITVGPNLASVTGLQIDQNRDGVLGDSFSGEFTLNTTAPATTNIGLDESNNLLIQDIDGSDTDDTISISINGSNIRINDPSNVLVAETGASQIDDNTVDVPISSITGPDGIVVDTLGGDDTLTIDFSGGNFPIAIDYYGGSQSSGDSLILTGGSTFTTAIFNFSNSNDGTIDIAGNSTITYAGLEPITANITATNVTLNYSNASETITVTDAGGGQTTVDSTAGETVTFNNPSGSLTINGGGGDDIFNITSLAANYPATITIDGQTGFDSFNLNGNVSLAADKNLSITCDTINVNSNISASGLGTVNLMAEQNITMTSSSSITTVNGNITLVGTSIIVSELDAGPKNVNLTAYTGAIVDDGDPGADVIAEVLTVDAATGIDLDTQVASVDLSITAAGNINITEVDGIVLTDVDTADGSVTVVTGGQITATDVDTSATDDGNNDILLTSLGAGIQVGSILAGWNNTVTLSASTGTISEVGVGTNITAAEVIFNGNVAPGGSPGRIKIDGDVVLGSDDTFTVELDGTTAGTSYDQLQVIGTSGQTVTLGNAALSLTLGYTTIPGDSFIIIDNANPLSSINGIFFGLPEGTTFWILSHLFIITYAGGDDNDVVLTAVNDAPVVTASGGSVSYTEGDGAVVIDAGLTVSDADDTNLEGATISVSSGYVNGEDILGFTNQLGITLDSWDSSTGVLILSGTSSVANYQIALRSITYTNSSDDPDTTIRTISFMVNDGDDDSNTDTKDINITAVNDDPVADAGADQTVVDADSDGSESVTLDGSGSWDMDGTIISYIWTEDGSEIATGISPNVTLSIGQHEITLKVTDNDGLIDTDTVVVTVNTPTTGTTATIGNTTVFSDVSITDSRRAMPFIILTDGSIESISIYHQGGSGHVILAVYTDDSGKPGTRIGVTDSTLINASEGWQTIALQSSVSVSAGQTVWLAWVFEDIPGIRYTSGTPGRASSGSAWSGGMPDDFGSSTTSNHIYSIYATYLSSQPLLGTTEVYKQVSTTANRRAMPFEATETGVLENISIYHEGGSGHVILAVYTDDSGKPGTRIGVTDSTLINASEGWQTIALQSPALISAGQTLWLAWVFEDNPGIRHTSGTPGRAHSGSMWSGGMPDDFGSSSTADYIYSICAVYASDTLQPPVADAGVDQTVVDADSDGSESVTLDGSGSWDVDGTIISYIWTEDSSEIATGINPVVSLSVGSHEITLTVTDNDGLIDTDTVVVTVNTPVGDEPVLSGIEGSALDYTENDGPVAITGTITVSDADDINMESAVIQITGNYQNGQDILAFTDTAGISGSWNATTGTLILTGSDTLANYEAALRSITYENTSDNPNILTRTVSFTVNDGDTDSNIQSRDITITAVNDAPLADAGADQTVTDADSDGSESVTLDGSGSWDMDGTIISYIWTEEGSEIATGINPVVSLSVGSHEITLTVTDNDSLIDTDTVVVTVNTPTTGTTSIVGNTTVLPDVSTTDNRRAMPFIMLTDGSTESISIYHQGGSGHVLLAVYTDDSGKPGTRIGVTDSTLINASEGWQTVDLQSPALISAGQTIYLAWVFEDIPGIRYTSGTPGRASSGSAWSGGMPEDFGTSTTSNYIYSIYATYLSSQPILGSTEVYKQTSTTANRRAMPFEATETGVLENISIYHEGGNGHVILAVYTDDSGKPGTRIGVTDSTLINASEGWQTIALQSPALISAGQTLWLAWVFEDNPGIRYTSGTPGRAHSDSTWSGGMPEDFGSSSIADYIYNICAIYNVINGDLVAFPDYYSNNEDTALVLSAPGVLNNDFDADDDALTAELVDDTSHGNLVLGSNGSFTYTPDENYNGTDSFTYKAYDGTDYSNVVSVTISVDPVNDATVVTNSVGDISYTEGDMAVVIETGLTISDIDDTDLEGATISISSGYFIGEDSLGFINQSGITGSWNSSTGVLTLLGTSSVANYQAALRSITYTNSSEDPDTTTRTISFMVNDGDDDSNTDTKDINITAVNDDPVLAVNTGDIILKGSSETIDNTELQVTDVDNNSAELQFTLTAIPTNGLLKLDGTALSISNTFTQADINNNLLNYDHDGSETTSDSFEFTVTDGSGGSLGITTFSILITSVNELPTVTLVDAVTSIPEDTDTTSRYKVADIVVDDDGVGTNDLSLNGDDSSLFGIYGAELYLIAGASLDYETNPVLYVTVAVDDTTVGSTPDDMASLTISIIDVNDAPDQPILVCPEDEGEDVDTNPTLEVNVSDQDSDTLDVTFYGREFSTGTGEDFTIIALPDTQHYSENYPAIFTAQTQWIVDNKDALNIVYVAHEGDIVDIETDITQWENADASMSLLEDPITTGLTDGIPYGILPGNHDMPTDNYNIYFGVSRFEGRSYYGGHYGTTNNNNYTFFSASGIDFIVINLEFDPGTAELDWADALLKTYSDYQAIVVSHSIISTDNSWTTQVIYTELQDNPNLFLMLCGHMHITDGAGMRTETGENGNTIYILLSDYQNYPNGGNGYLRIMRFSPEDDKIYVQTYSPTLDGYLTDPENEFELDYEMIGESFKVLDTVSGITNGNSASITWADLSPGTQYEWYVDIFDGSETTTSPTWSFTTA